MGTWTNCLSDANTTATMTQGANIRPIHPNEIQEKIENDYLILHYCLCPSFAWDYLPVAVGDKISFNEWEELKYVIDAIKSGLDCIADYIVEAGCATAQVIHWTVDKNTHCSSEHSGDNVGHNASVNTGDDGTNYGTHLGTNQVTQDLAACTSDDSNNYTGYDSAEDRYDDSAQLSGHYSTNNAPVLLQHYQTANQNN